MTQQIARNYVSSTSPKRTKAEGQAVIEQMIGLSKEMLGGAGEHSTINLATDAFQCVTDYCLFPLEVETGTSDDLKTITFNPSPDLRDGYIIGVRCTNAGHPITVKNGGGGNEQIFTRTGRDLVLNKTDLWCWLKYNLAARAWYQIIPDWTNVIDLALGSRPGSVLTIASSQVTVDRAIHKITAVAASNIDQILGTPHDGALLLISAADATYTYTARHNITGAGKLNLIGGANIALAVNVWLLLAYNAGTSAWDHILTINNAQLPTSGIAKGSLAVFDGSLWKNIGVGTDGQQLQADSAQSLGVKWATPAGGSGKIAGVFDGRLTLTSGTPVTTTDVTAATSLYVTPFRGNSVGLYISSVWTLKTFSEITLSLSGLTASLPYDVFVFWNGSAVAAELLAWTNGTTRATALTKQDQVYVKTGATDRLYVGTIRITPTTGQCEDSRSRRFVWNAYNRVLRNGRAVDTTDTWTYNSNTFRSFNGNTTDGVGAFSFVLGLSEDLVKAEVISQMWSGTGYPCIGIGVDSTSVNSAQIALTYAGASYWTKTNIAKYASVLAPGNHSIYPLERVDAAGGYTLNNFGDNGMADTQHGLMVEVFA